jgi:hypothetical protein
VQREFARTAAPESPNNSACRLERATAPMFAGEREAGRSASVDTIYIRRAAAEDQSVGQNPRQNLRRRPYLNAYDWARRAPNHFCNPSESRSTFPEIGNCANGATAYGSSPLSQPPRRIRQSSCHNNYTNALGNLTINCSHSILHP